MDNKDNEVFVLHLEADGSSYWTGPGFDDPKPKRKTKKTENKEEVSEVVDISENPLQ